MLSWDDTCLTLAALLTACVPALEEECQRPEDCPVPGTVCQFGVCVAPETSPDLGDQAPAPDARPPQDDGPAMDGDRDALADAAPERDAAPALDGSPVDADPGPPDASPPADLGPDTDEGLDPD